MSTLASAFVLAQESAGEISVNLTLPGLLALAAGIIILIVPRVLNYVVALYLILVGLIQIFDITI